MKKKLVLLTLIFLFFSKLSFSQQRIESGEYENGLKLQYNAQSNEITGYFESYTGAGQFSCIFYIEWKVTGSKFKIKTYYPDDKKDDFIEGAIEIVNSKTVKIKLPEEHGGCWNVQHFADEAVTFELVQPKNWMQIRYVDTKKAYFYKAKFIAKKLQSYLVKADFVCIEKMENEWVYCTYYGEKKTSGWILEKDLNKM